MRVLSADREVLFAWVQMVKIECDSVRVVTANTASIAKLNFVNQLSPFRYLSLVANFYRFLTALLSPVKSIWRQPAFLVEAIQSNPCLGVSIKNESVTSDITPFEWTIQLWMKSFSWVMRGFRSFVH